MQRAIRRGTTVFLAAAVAAAGFVVTGSRVHAEGGDGESDHHVVHAGQLIQPAIDAAKPGDVIEVEKGTYAENLSINTDNLTLEGDGAALVLPGQPTHPCDPVSVDGICVANAPNPDGSVSKLVKNVHISGFTIGGFSGAGIFMFGNSGARIEDVTANDNSSYGVVAFTSTGTHIVGNTTRRNGEAGIYLGDSENADAVVRDNVSTDNLGFGVFVRNAAHGTAVDNKVSGNCVGIGLVHGGPGVPPSDWTLRDNEVTANNNACASFEGRPPTSGIGILILNGNDNNVTDNEVRDNQGSASRPSLASGGIVVLSIRGESATGNHIAHNELDGNTPFDILLGPGGTGNVFADNECGTSNTAGLCNA